MSSFKDFITNNGIIATTAGITIGFATATFVKSFVADVVLPVFFLLLVKGTGKVSSSTSGFFSKFLSNKEFLFTNFISEFVTWILVVLAAWLILDLAYKYLVSKDAKLLPTMTNPFTSKPASQEHREHYMESSVGVHGVHAPVASAVKMFQQQPSGGGVGHNAAPYGPETFVDAHASQPKGLGQSIQSMIPFF